MTAGADDSDVDNITESEQQQPMKTSAVAGSGPTLTAAAAGSSARVDPVHRPMVVVRCGLRACSGVRFARLPHSTTLTFFGLLAFMRSVHVTLHPQKKKP